MSQKRVYLFGNGKAEGNAKMREELGGKGANLAEMNHIGVPVPPGFTITTDCCNEYYQVGQQKIMELLNDDVMAAVKHIENLMNCKFGDAQNPLLVSVRSGARASMPGMMDTILNLGLNDEVAEGMAKKTNNPHFVYDSYRRFVQMYGDVVLEMKPVAIIGAAGDASSLAISDYVDEAKVPAITPSATNPLITQSSQYYFRACMTDSQMGEGLAEYACRKLGADSIAVITIKNDTSTSALLDGFYDKIKEIRGKRDRTVTVRTEIQPNEDEMKAALKQIRSSGAEACFVSMGSAEMDTFFTLAEKMKMTDVTFLGTRNWGDPEFVSMMGRHKGIKVVFPYESVLTKSDDTSDTATEEAQRFQIEYANRYGVDDVSTDNAALGYDSYLLVINAIHNSKSLKGSDIRAGLRGLKDLKCATGVFSFDNTGNVVRAVTLSTIKGGKPVTEYVTKSETEARKLEDIENSGEEEVH